MTLTISTDDLLVTCVADEAAGECYEGKVAVARVLLNRMALKYESDGTIEGTVLKKFQFSGFWFAMKKGHYTEINWDQTGAEATAADLCAQFKQQHQVWLDCTHAIVDAKAGTLNTLAHPNYRKMTDHTVLYLNPAISKALWATTNKLDTTIGHHNFYHD